MRLPGKQLSQINEVQASERDPSAKSRWTVSWVRTIGLFYGLLYKDIYMNPHICMRIPYTHKAHTHTTYRMLILVISSWRPATSLASLVGRTWKPLEMEEILILWWSLCLVTMPRPQWHPQQAYLGDWNGPEQSLVQHTLSHSHACLL